MKFKRILCGVDFSEASVQAFDTAVELARSFGAELHVVHVVEADPSIPDLSLETKAATAMNTLVSDAAGQDEQLQITSDVTTGTAWSEILDRSRERNVDLIVLGAKGITLLGEGLFGGTAKRIFNDAPCSVLAVRE
jgi:nucleotide-binding universal stress UspA family protein